MLDPVWTGPELNPGLGGLGELGPYCSSDGSGKQDNTHTHREHPVSQVLPVCLSLQGSRPSVSSFFYSASKTPRMLCVVFELLVCVWPRYALLMERLGVNTARVSCIFVRTSVVWQQGPNLRVRNPKTVPTSQS